MSYINQVIILQCDPPSLHYCTLPKMAFLSPLVWPFPLDSLEDKSMLMLLVHFKKASPIALLGHSF